MFAFDGAAVMTSTLVGSSAQTCLLFVRSLDRNALGGLSVLHLYCKHVCIHTDWLVHKRLKKNTTSCMFWSFSLLLEFQYNFSQHEFSLSWLRIQLLATPQLLIKYCLFVENKGNIWSKWNNFKKMPSKYILNTGRVKMCKKKMKHLIRSLQQQQKHEPFIHLHHFLYNFPPHPHKQPPSSCYLSSVGENIKEVSGGEVTEAVHFN